MGLLGGAFGVDVMDSQQDANKRRGFLKEIAAGVIGGFLALAPAAAGLAVFFDPLRRTGTKRGFVKVASLDAIPDDGTPRKFSVLADKQDAWNKLKNVPVGAVYLRRGPDDSVEALNVICPHAGCFVDFKDDQDPRFFCPCHNSSFALDGSINDEKSPSPRGMDALETEVRDGGEVWVRFQNFRTAKKEKEPIA